MNDNSINRDQLIKLVGLVRPALSTQDYIPALKHIQFADGFATTYNDNTAIRVAVPDELNLNVCLPGDMLAKSLGSFNAERVALQISADGGMVMSSGRSKLKGKTLPANEFPLTLPKGQGTVIALSDEMLAGIRLCLMSVGNNPHHPACMGVTLDVLDGRAVLYSTDNASISRYATKSKASLPGDSPVIMPTFFCEQLGALARAFPKAEVELELFPGALQAYFYGPADEVQAQLFTKTLVDLVPVDFPTIVAKHCKVGKIADELVEIPAAFDAAWERALLILSSELDKATRVTCGDGVVKLLSLSEAGEASDSITIDAAGPDDPFYVDPTMILRASKQCAKLAFLPRVVVFGDASGAFLHLIAHCSSK